MIPTVFGSVTPGWAGMSPGPVWPGLGAISLSSIESAPSTGPMGGAGGPGFGGGFGQFGQPTLGWGLGTAPLIATPLTTPFAMPGNVTAPALIAAIAMRRGQPHGPASDQDVEEFIYDALELLPGAAEVEVRCEGGRVSLTGSAPHKRIKHDAGEIAWAIPGIIDVNNTIAITTRRRSRAFNREAEAQPSGQGRKQA